MSKIGYHILRRPVVIFLNNLSDNSIKRFIVDRKAGCSIILPKGDTASTTAYTMVEMEKVNELNIFKSINYLLNVMLSFK